jgi:hypothetical protein
LTGGNGGAGGHGCGYDLADGTREGSKGGNGAPGVTCKSISFTNAYGNILIKGGNGGNGGSGGNSLAKSNSGSGVLNGGSGGNGGNADYAIAALETPIYGLSKPLLLGGQGGNGGAGGKKAIVLFATGVDGSSGLKGLNTADYYWFNLSQNKEVYL